jgi:hypothetical protein
MSWTQPGRARRILIEREDAPQESWERGKGDDDQLWYDQITPSRGSIRSPELVERISAAIEASK